MPLHCSECSLSNRLIHAFEQTLSHRIKPRCDAMMPARCAIVCCLFAFIPLEIFSTVLEAAVGEPGGDVLRPDRGKTGATLFLGGDLGVQYARYMGDLTFSTASPFRSDVLLWAPFEDGSGLGFILNATVDVPLTPDFGIVGKLGYISRTDKFSSTHIDPIFYTDPLTGYPAPATLESALDMDVSFLNIDLLLRYQLVPREWYVLGGLSYSNLLTHRGPFDQKILLPVNVSYADAASQPTGIRKVSGEYELTAMEKSRIAAKIGVGTWIPIGKDIFLTPELAADYPLTKAVDAPGYPFVFIPGSDASVMTVTLTLGLRFGL